VFNFGSEDLTVDLRKEDTIVNEDAEQGNEV
jgi:hypothetical protein